MRHLGFLLAIATVGIAAAQSTPKQGITKEQVGSSTQVSTTPDNKQRDPKVSAVVKQENAAPQDDHRAENPDDIQIQKSNLNLTRWLVVVGGIQAVILFFTIRAINQQTDTNRNIERAWIMAELRCSPGTDLFFGDDGSSGTTTNVIGIELHCTNDGNSPAWITEKSARLVIIGEGELPEQPQLAKEDIIADGPEPMGPGRESAFTWNATCKGRHSLQTATLIYGVVRYTDIFKKRRETWFCYQMRGYKTNRTLFRISGYPEYNKNT